VVGAILGALVGGLAVLAAQILPHGLVVAVAFAAMLVLSGAIHVDGFLDSCDALFASVTPQRRLEIMDDPQHGTFAIVGMALLTVVWTASVSSIAPSHYPAVLAWSAALARACAVVQAFLFPYGRRVPSRAFSSRPSRFVLGAELLVLAGVGFFVVPYGAVIAVGALVFSWLIAHWIASKLAGGLTGDSYGFAICLVELGVLVAAATIEHVAG
jgi:adenosylcobinamide-GDP ribazoletransferase